MPTWVFDVDGCLIDALTGSSLRPGAAEIFEHLSRRRGTSVLWSAGGAEYARQRAEQHGIHGWFAGFYGKGDRDENGHYGAGHLPSPGPYVFIDDQPEDIDPRYRRIGVPPYLRDDPHDRGLRVVALLLPGEGCEAGAPLPAALR